MIRNEREYKITRANRQRFADAVADFDRCPPEGDAILVKAQRDSLVAQLEDLTDEILAFEALKNNQQPLISVVELEQLPMRLIQTRVAVGLSQKSLASALGVTPQQVQKDEASAYQNVSYAKLLQIARLLEKRRVT
jgi:HTH-type transcriptional regulator / antitoxin HigA